MIIPILDIEGHGPFIALTDKTFDAHRSSSHMMGKSVKMFVYFLSCFFFGRQSICKETKMKNKRERTNADFLDNQITPENFPNRRDQLQSLRPCVCVSMCRHLVNQFGDLLNDTFHAFFFLSLSLLNNVCLIKTTQAT